MSKAAFSLLQTGLRDLGYSPGAIDGVFGLKSQAAMAGFVAAGHQPAINQVAPVTKGMIYQGSARYPVREVIIHCSDTPPSWMGNRTLAEQVAEIRRWHIEERGWRDIGYHWIIGRNGIVASGRAETTIPAQVEGHNAGVIGICLIGGNGSSATDQFSRHFTAVQNVTLRQMLQGISMRTQITRISGHNDYAAKACPGFTVSQWLKETI